MQFPRLQDRTNLRRHKPDTAHAHRPRPPQIRQTKVANDDLLSDDEEVVNLPVPVSTINRGGTALSAPALSTAAAPSPVAVMPSEILLLMVWIF